ncbi:hypothetical protein HFO56_02120 [Rhizobium laguerreae]|uniref:hypothetical protein n=1 Tax=Rhizobium laguerreae TaxID=1076926 RepID=UPI001C90075E|nr:hypothetical protein [Rhizobium laguerreae]MBY3151201.1 hypothetical protein [Rhizobium laguerreae]MBY3433393.1 hypothetical protein [Rhizobium laguerreae]
MQIEDENPLHDIHSEIAYDDLVEIDLEPFFGAPDEVVEAHIRSLANRASIGQLRQALSIPLNAEDREREVLVDMFVERKMVVVLKIKSAIQSI